MGQIVLVSEDGEYALQGESDSSLTLLVAEVGFTDPVTIPEPTPFYSPYRAEPCPPPVFYVARCSYTARCTAPKTGAPVTRTAEACSSVSIEQAQGRALRCARTAAEAALVCQYEANALAEGGCGHISIATGYSSISYADALENAQAKAEADADEWCASHGPSYISTQVANFTATCPDGYDGDPVEATREATVISYVSQDDADAQALEQATVAATAAATEQLVCTEVNYTSTQEYTATCPDGYAGSPVTREATRTSNESQEAADALALAAAQEAAEAALECFQPVYTGTATVTVSCPEGYVGSDQTATASATSLVSMDDAYANAVDLATATATEQLNCVPFTYTAEATYEATCPDGYTGDPVTATGHGYSTVSQDEADANALAQATDLATASLECTPVP